MPALTGAAPKTQRREMSSPGARRYGTSAIRRCEDRKGQIWLHTVTMRREEGEVSVTPSSCAKLLQSGAFGVDHIGVGLIAFVANRVLVRKRIRPLTPEVA